MAQEEDGCERRRKTIDLDCFTTSTLSLAVLWRKLRRTQEGRMAELQTVEQSL